MKQFKQGFRHGIPIGIGYLSVSFTFGIMAVSYGLNTAEALLVSMTNLTSAGQFAGISIMAAGGSYIEMFIAQATINLRYSLMSIALSQKVDQAFRGKYRWILGHANTDEIFALAISNKEAVSREYFAGLAIAPYCGWSLGTLAGALLGAVIPDSVSSGLGIALYGMFIAIVIPKMKGNRKISITVLLSVVLSCGFKYIPILSKVSIGFSITICAIVASVIGAILFPVDNTE